MLTLSFGYKLPETGDKGDVFFPALEDNIVRLNGHDHDGVNSSVLPSTSFAPTVITLLAANWVASGDWFRQLVTLPGTVQFTDVLIQAFLGGVLQERIYPRQDYVGVNQFYVYMPTNSDDVRLIIV